MESKIKNRFFELVINYFKEEEEMDITEYPEIVDFVNKALETSIEEAINIVLSKHAPKIKKNLKAFLVTPNALMIYEESKPKVTEKKSLRIIVIGMTRSGKTSLINCFYTWSKGWQKLQDFQNVLISTPYFVGVQGGEPQELMANLGQSQTQKSNFYEFQLNTGQTIYNLQFMDTPGLGDTRGQEQDERNIKNILETISKTPELNAIILMVNGSDPAIKPPLLLAIEKVKSIIPNVVVDNVIVLLTNVADQANLNLKHLDLQIHESRIFTINNSIFSADPSDESKLQINNSNYQQSIKVLGNIIELASQMNVNKTRAFQELKESRDSYISSLANLKQQIFYQMKRREANQACQDKIDYISKQDSIDGYTFLISFYEEEVTNTHNTRCVLCYENCHMDCKLNETEAIGNSIFQRCGAFTLKPTNILKNKFNCGICCHSYRYHVHQKSMYKRKTVLYSFNQEVKEQFNKAHKDYTQTLLSGIFHRDDQLVLRQKKKAEILKIAINQKFQSINQEIFEMKSQIEIKIAEFQSLCSNFNAKKHIELAYAITNDDFGDHKWTDVQTERLKQESCLQGIMSMSQ